jgi:putative glutamine amidotransferase
MHKLLIAGYPEQTGNYQNVCSKLFIPFDTLPAQAPGMADTPTLSAYAGLILPGGGDMDPTLLDVDSTHFRNVDAALDRIQLRLLDTFVKEGKPILGICKGMQMINIYFGGSLTADLPAHSLAIHQYEGQDKIHSTKAAQGTFPELLYGKAPVTNSAHHQAVYAVGDELRVAQYSSDFVVEALYHEKLPVLGVQWHPERMCFSYARPEVANGSMLFRYFMTLL